MCYLHWEDLLSKPIQTLYFVDVHQLGFCGQDPTTISTREKVSSAKSMEAPRNLTATPRVCHRPGLWGWQSCPLGEGTLGRVALTSGRLLLNSEKRKSYSVRRHSLKSTDYPTRPRGQRCLLYKGTSLLTTMTIQF